MNCQEVRDLVEEAQDKRLGVACMGKVSLHLSRCPTCRAFYDAERREHTAIFRALNDVSDIPQSPTPQNAFASKLAYGLPKRAKGAWAYRLRKWMRRAAVFALFGGSAAFASWMGGVWDGEDSPETTVSETNTTLTVTEGESTMKAGKIAATTVAAVLATANVSAGDAYAYKVQYLESTGVQYIDTGVVPNINTMFTGSYEYLGTVGTKANYDMIAACNSPRYYPVSLYNASDTHALHERYVSNNDVPNQTHLYRTRHDIVFNDAERRVFVDNRYFATLTTGFSGASYSCYLFASNDKGTAKYYSKARIFGCEFVDTSTGTVLRRFVPVVDKDGKPAMFDEVNETLYYNLGSGDFKAGPRKEEPWYFVEYLESTGTQWIDTGLPATSTTRTDARYMYTQQSQNDTAMIGGIQSPSRYYPISLYSKNGLQERYVMGDTTFRANYSALVPHDVVFNESSRVFVDGILSWSFSSDFTDSTYPMYMFAARNVNDSKADWLAKARIWHYNVCTNYGTMCAAFRPAVNSSGAGCMYDDYNGAIHENSGSGDFTLGRIISPTVAIDLSSRTDLAEDLKVLSFSVRPSWGTVFELDETSAATYDPEVRSDGVYLAAKGDAAAGVVTVTGDTSAQFASDDMPTCSSVVLSGTVRLTADCDWRGLGVIVIPDGVTIDLNGHNLLTEGFTAIPGTLGIVTDSSADGSGGELHVEVAENDLFVNSSVPLLGSLKLVKEGAGLYYAELGGHQYSGGTEVVEGTLRMKHVFSVLGHYDWQVPQSGEVIVRAGGVFDVNGNSWGYHLYTLDGGILASSTPAEMKRGTVSSPFTLTSDSVVSNEDFGVVGKNYVQTTMDMNGHTLRYDGRSNTGNAFFFTNVRFEGEGTLEVGSSWICPTNSSYQNIGYNLSLVQPSAASGGLMIEAPFTVSNCVIRSTSQKGSSTLTVLGTFSPLEYCTNHFPNVALADGSTLDLSGCEGCAFNVVDKTGNRLTFPDGTVTLDISSRTDLADGMKLITWDELPATTKFKLRCGGMRWRSRCEFDGLYLVSCGFTIIVR